MNLLRLDPLRAPLVHRRWLSLLPLLAPGLAVANPTGGQVIAGQVSIGNPNALTTVVNQSSQTAVINWQQFNVGSQELVQFVQPSASAAILNRIVGGNPSEILGNLSANGRVFLINPQGLMFGAGSRVDVGGLMASTLDIKDSDFLAGRYVFAGNGSSGSVVNAGRLQAADGGFIVLAGDSSRNTGLIQARLGDVVLASGSAMTLDLNGDGLVTYAVNGAALSSAAAVSNTGELLADGGRVLMTADVARGLVANAVNNTGLVRAAGIGEQDGEIALVGLGGNVVNSGTLDASSARDKGGEIQVLGDRDVLINGGLVDASGALGGGSVRIGGGVEGGEGLVQAERTYLARDAVVRADATRKGDGGDIVAFSSNQSVLAGLLSARGNGRGGDGGFVETSSHGVLNVTRAPLVSGLFAGSQGGHWLIDPNDITIVAGSGYGGINSSNPFLSGSDDSQLGVDLIKQALGQGSLVTVTTGYGGRGLGNITLSTELDYNGTGGGTLVFDADNDIIIQSTVFDSDTSVIGDELALTLNAGRDIKILADVTVDSATISNTGGHLSLAAGKVFEATGGGVYADSGSATIAGTVSGAGFVNINTYSGDFVGDGLFLSDGSISLYAFGDGTQPHPTLRIGKALAGGSVYLNSGGAIQITGDDSRGDGVVVGRDNVSLSGDSISSSGNIFVTGDDDVSLSLYAGAGNISVTGALGAYSNYGGAFLDADAYFGYEDPDSDGIFTIKPDTGKIDISGAVTVRAATVTNPNRRPLYVFGSQVFTPPAAYARLDADGDLSIGDIDVSSYTALTYDLIDGGYGGTTTGYLETAPTGLLINQGGHRTAGSVQTGSIKVSGYGDSAALISGTGSVTVNGSLAVGSFGARYQDLESVSSSTQATQQVITDDRQFGTGSVEITEFQPAIGTANGYGGVFTETSADFAVDIGGSLSVLGPNALARIEAGTLHIGADANGQSVTVQAYAFTDKESFRNAYQRVFDPADPFNPVYSSTVSIAQAEFISTAAATNSQGQAVDGQLYEGRIDVSGGQAGLRLRAANGGTIRLIDAASDTGPVAGSIAVRALGYTVDGDFFDYGHNQFSFGNTEGLTARNTGPRRFGLPALDAPTVTRLTATADKPYLQWGAGRLEVLGGSFDTGSGNYLDAPAGNLRVSGDVSVDGVGIATGNVFANVLDIDGSASVQAARGAVFGELAEAYYAGTSVFVAGETIVTSPATETEAESGYRVIRTLGGDPDNLVETTTGRAPVNAASSAYAGLSLRGADQVSVGGSLTVTGLTAEAELKGSAVTVGGAIRIDGRPQDSTPSYYREDVRYIGYGPNAPVKREPATSIAVGGRSGLDVAGEVVRLNGGVDVRGTLIAGLSAVATDLQITGDIGIDAATGRVQSNDTDFTSSPVSTDLGIAALIIGSADGSPARLVAGAGGTGSLTLTGTTDVQLGGVNLVADGGMTLRATGADGIIRDSVQDLVLEFPHPLDYRVNTGFALPPPGGGVTIAAEEVEPTINQLLEGFSRACFVTDGVCSSRLVTNDKGGGGDIALGADVIDASRLIIQSAGGISAAADDSIAAGEIVLGTLAATGPVRIGTGATAGSVATADTVTVGNITSGGSVVIGSRNDVHVGSRIQGQSVTVDAGRDLVGPVKGNLEIRATEGDVTLKLRNVNTSGGSFIVDAQQGISLVTDTLNLGAFDFFANDLVSLSARSLALTGGVLDASTVRLTATGSNAGNGISLTDTRILGDRIEASGRSISLIDAHLEGHTNSEAANTMLLSSVRPLQITDSSLVTRTGGNVELISSNDSLELAATSVDASTVNLSGRQGVQLTDSTIRTGSDGAVTIGSSAGVVTVIGSQVQANSISLKAAGAITIDNTSLNVAPSSNLKALTAYPAGLIKLDGRGVNLRSTDVSGGDVTLLGGTGTVVLDGGKIEGNVVRIEANAVTTPSAITIKANGFGARGSVLDFGQAALTLGTASAPFGSDEGLLALLGKTGGDLLPGSVKPNASFVASRFLALGNIGGTANYLLLDTPDFSFNGTIRGSSNLFLQIVPGIDDEAIGVSDLGFTQFVRTLAIGSANFSGDIAFIDTQSPGGKALNGGRNTNYVLLTEGRVIGADKITTSGRVLVLSEAPQPPTVPDEIEMAPAGDLVPVGEQFTPAEDQEQEEAQAVVVEQGLNGGNDVITDDSSNAKQQCDAV